VARVADIEAEALDMLRLRVLALLDGATPRNAVARIDAVEDALLRGYDVLLEAVIAEVARELVEWDLPTAAVAETSAALRQARLHVRDDVERYAREARGTPKDQGGPLAGLQRLATNGMGLVDTALMAADRAVSIAQAEATGIEWWLYDGPVDQRTRDDCRAWAGHRFTSAQVASLKSRAGPQPPSLYGGGWNCRHRWAPLDESELAQYPPWPG